MSGIKISALPPIVTPAATDLFATVQAAVTYKVTGTQLGTLFVPITGGTMTGPLVLSGLPTVSTQAASKAYVDSIAQGITVQGACVVATAAALTATYANGASGVGATLTNAGAFAALTIDGVLQVVGNRVLVKTQAAPAQNGIYTVTIVGDGVSVNWVLTRATDYDQVAEINPGDLVIIESGTVNAGSSWIETATVAVIGTDAISFSKFTTALPVTVPNGGTGLTSTTINQILYSSAANTIAGLATANYGVLVTSSAGVPSISAGGQIPGTRTNDSASAGNIGEFISSNVLIGAPVALASGVASNITSIVLTPGDWDVEGFIATIPAAGTTTTAFNFIINIVSATNPTPSPNVAVIGGSVFPANPDQIWALNTGKCRISVAINTTTYLIAQVTFAVSTMGAYGWIAARRVR